MPRSVGDTLELVRDRERLVEIATALRGRVAIDTEFHAEQRYRPVLLLVQLREEGGRPVLIDPLAVRDLKPLGKALSERPLLTHAPQQDLLLLQRHAGLAPRELVDVQVLAGFCGLGYPRSLDDLVETVLQRRMPPSRTLSDWTRRPLELEQLAYASADVDLLFDLERALLGRLPPFRQAQALAAGMELARRALAPPAPRASGAWIDGPTRRTLQRLLDWRERLAAQLDQPAGSVAPDGVLLDLARRRPRNADEIAANRRVSRRLARDYAAEVVALCQPDGGPPEPPDPPRVAERAAREAVLAAWAAIVEQREGISARLLLPPELRDRLLDGQGLPLGDWRAEWSEELDRILRGHTGVRL